MFSKRNTHLTGLAAASAALVMALPATADATTGSATSGWQIYQAPVSGQAVLDSVVAPAADDAWAAGFTVDPYSFSPLMLHWNGSAWTDVSVPGTDKIDELTDTGGDDVWAATDDQPLHWNGATWSAVPLKPVPDMDQGGPIAADGAHDAWYLGNTYDPDTGAAANFVEEWNGRAWHTAALPAALADTDGLAQIAAHGPDDVWVAGATATGTLLFAHWNGRSWTSVPGPATGFAYTDLSRLLNAGPDDAWLAGWGEISDGKGADRISLVAHWNGSSWALSPTPSGDGELYDMALTPGGAWAVGDTYHETDVAYTADALRWTGTAWLGVAVPTTGEATLAGVAAIPGGGVWAVGSTSGDAGLSPTVAPVIARHGTN